MWNNTIMKNKRKTYTYHTKLLQVSTTAPTYSLTGYIYDYFYMKINNSFYLYNINVIFTW